MSAGRDRGAVSVHAAWIAIVLVVATLVIVQTTQLVRMRHQVASAADLAALAGSQASARGDDGCAAARSVARRNGVSLTRCRMDFDVATVTARATSDAWWGKRWATEQRARAAPVSYLSRGQALDSWSRASRSLMAPNLSRGSLPLPHLGEWTHDGQPLGHSQAAIASRVTRNHLAAIS